MNNPSNPGFPVFGISPLGGNGVDGTDTEAVPLVYDARVDAFISKLAKMELDDQDIDLVKNEDYRQEQEYRRMIGINIA